VVTEEDVDDLRPVRVEHLLVSRVAGVQVLQLPGGGITVRIRGATSLNGSSEPLYVVDGVPVSTSNGRGLDWLNPADIAKIEVLKDAIGTSAWGVRGANGVVLITTRRGKR
jgi:TonB-dependent SusC/RagA subfamily outer membrane receptor